MLQDKTAYSCHRIHLRTNFWRSFFSFQSVDILKQKEYATAICRVANWFLSFSLSLFFSFARPPFSSRLPKPNITIFECTQAASARLTANVIFRLRVRDEWRATLLFSQLYMLVYSSWFICMYVTPDVIGLRAASEEADARVITGIAKMEINDARRRWTDEALVQGSVGRHRCHLTKHKDAGQTRSG